MPDAVPAVAPSKLQAPVHWAALTALGIVYGDLGTSPLYTLQTVLQATGGRLTPETALGVLSLIILDADHHGLDQVLCVCHARRQPW